MALPQTDLTEIHRLMVLSRAMDRAAAKAYGGYFPSEGEEAVIVGAFYGLDPSDILAPHYRGPFIVFHMRGVPLADLFTMVLGKATSYSKGRAPSFSGPVERGFVPWMGTDLGPSLSLAVGAAFALKYRKMKNVAIHTFGDGTSNRGDFHEALNMAAIWKLPIVFVCQNNHYSISMHLSKVMAAKEIADRALGYGMPGVSIDGNDVVAVHEAVQEAVARARAGLGPSLVEAKTYRLGGHWAADPTTYRPREEVEVWRERDPIPRLEALLRKRNFATDAHIKTVWSQAEGEVAAALAKAQEAPSPGEAELGIGETFVQGVR